jgi:hypothetical protein
LFERLGRIAIWQTPARLDADVVVPVGPDRKKWDFGKIEPDAFTEIRVLEDKGPARNMLQTDQVGIRKLRFVKGHFSSGKTDLLLASIEEIARSVIAHVRTSRTQHLAIFQ